MDSIGKLVVVLIIIIVLFLILREFWCWYWKINEIRDLLRQISQSLKGANENSLSNTKDKLDDKYNSVNDDVIETSADSLSPIHESMAKKTKLELLEIAAGTKSEDYTEKARAAANDILGERKLKQK